MPQQRLTEKQRAAALQVWWAAFPYGSTTQREKAIQQFEQQYGPLTDAEHRAARFRWSPEDKARVGISQWHMAPTDIGEEAALKLRKQLLDDSHYDLLLSETGIVETPDFEPLAILLKKRLPQDLLDEVRPIVHKAASQRSVASGRRGDAAGTGMQPRRRKDGTVGKMTAVPNKNDLNDKDYNRIGRATDGAVGFLDRMIGGGQVYPCRLTYYDGALPEELALMSKLCAAVADVFRQSYVTDKWETQFTKAANTPLAWLIRSDKGITPFTTITCNKSFRTAAHIDDGDLKEGFGVMCCLGDFEGCDLVFPRYRTAVRYREGDVLLANVHQVHGNTPLLTPEGKEPLAGREPERLVCVFYYRQKMDQCESTRQKELSWLNNRERGDAVRKGNAKKAKARAKGAGK